MPIMTCKLESGESGIKWGEGGSCYPDTDEGRKQMADEARKNKNVKSTDAVKDSKQVGSVCLRGQRGEIM